MSALETHWQFSRPPFTDGPDLDYYFPADAHEEALARIGYLLEQRRRVGVVAGCGGSGKSLVLAAARRQALRSGQAVALCRLRGHESAGSWLWSAADQLATPREADDTLEATWRKLADRIRELQWEGTSLAILVDDADGAGDRAVEALLRLQSLGDSAGQGGTLLLTTSSDRAPGLIPFTRQAELRIQLTPWRLREVDDFLRTSLAAAGCHDGLFDAEAVARFTELSAGNPRRVSQLARLALLAAAGQQRPQVDGETVAAVFDELAVTV